MKINENVDTKVIKITEEQDKKLYKLKFYLDAVLGEDENKIYMDGSIYRDEGVYDTSGVLADINHNTIDLNDLECAFLENILEDCVNKTEDESFYYLDDDDSTGGGTIKVTYNPDDKTIESVLEYDVVVPQQHPVTKSFETLSKSPKPWWGSEYKYLKNLTNEEYVKTLQEYYGSWVEITYDGYGDSGQVNDECESENDKYNIMDTDFELLIYEIIDSEFSGWENDRGSSGVVTLNFETKEVENNHTYYENDYKSVDIQSYKLST